MGIRFIIFCSLLSSSLLFAEVQNSVIPKMHLTTRDLTGRINEKQQKAIDQIDCAATLRVMSFNMLFNLYDDKLETPNRWENRGARVVEYLQWAQPDLIGSQELQEDQIATLMADLGDEYCYFGTPHTDENPAIFYKRDRLKLLEGKNIQFRIPSNKTDKHFTVCRFLDLATNRQFIAVNTHLAFTNIEKRYQEAVFLRDYVNTLDHTLPILVTGDFNAFPFREELTLPFFDGDEIKAIIEESPVKDSMKKAILGHIGPIASTSFSIEKNRCFCGEGTPGVIIDFIFVNKQLQVIRHAIDSAQVNNYYLSDHFPVLVDLEFSSKS